jgi:hypothetical protein
MEKQIKKTIEREHNKLKFKCLFNDLLLESINFLEVKVYFKNGFYYKVKPKDNTILNKYLIRRF